MGNTPTFRQKNFLGNYCRINFSMQQKFHPIPSIPNQSAETGTLLLIEDNPDDIFLMRRALNKSGLEMPLQIVTDGKQALDYLSGPF